MALTVTSAYDQLNPPGPDYDYWLARIRSLAPAAVTDLGCGTGQLTVLIAQDGPATGGVDPDPAMLEVARHRSGHELVTWLDGTAAVIPTSSTDVIIMTSHVSQVFVTDDMWLEALHHIRRSLRAAGHVLFDMRNPDAQGWRAWNPTDSRASVELESGPAERWHLVTDVRDGLVSFDTVYRPIAGLPDSVVSDTLRFRSADELRTTLDSAGFDVVRIDGDWDGSPVTPERPELIVTARLR